MSSWAAASPAADDTEGRSARSAGSAPISRAAAERASLAACSLRVQSSPCAAHSSTSAWYVSASRRLARPVAAVLKYARPTVAGNRRRASAMSRAATTVSERLSLLGPAAVTGP